MSSSLGKKLVALFAVILSCAAFAGPTQSSFTPTTYQYPISKISLFKADYTGEQVLYQCTGATSEDCLVDVTSEASLKAIEDASAAVALQPGEYAYLSLSACPAGTTGLDIMNVHIMGSVSLGADFFATNEGATGGMLQDGTPELATIPIGCGGAQVKLLQPLVVTEGSAQTLTMLVDLTHVTWTDANVSGGMGGCRGGNPGEQGICTSFPFIVPYVGTGTPTFERYLISHLASSGDPDIADANAEINLAVDPSDQVFYVGVHPYYSLTSPGEYDLNKGGPDYNTSTRALSTNSDGTIAFQTGGSAEDNRAGFTAFARDGESDGICKDELSSSPLWYYRAFRE